MSLKSDFKYFVVPGNEFGLNPRDMDNKELITLEEAEKTFKELKVEVEAVAMFKIEKGLITLIKDYYHG